VYGCTHYPLLDAHFAASLGRGVLRLDPATAQVDAAAGLVAARGIAPGSGKVEYVTTGNPEAFGAAVRAWTGEARPLVSGLHQAHTRR
jgi:glutamate racemase